MRTQGGVDDTLSGGELAGSGFSFPVSQRSFYPLITGDNGVLLLFKATPPAGRRGRSRPVFRSESRGHGRRRRRALRPQLILSPSRWASEGLPGTPLERDDAKQDAGEGRCCGEVGARSGVFGRKPRVGLRKFL